MQTLDHRTSVLMPTARDWKKTSYLVVLRSRDSASEMISAESTRANYTRNKRD
jgi:hypothetical protein